MNNTSGIKDIYKQSALLITIIGSILTASSVAADSNILFILDASNSMHGQIAGESKMATAKRVLGDLLKELPPETKVGLMAYGNNISRKDKKACSDINVLSPVGTESPGAIAKKVAGLQAKGQTPLAAALNKSVEAFKSAKGDNNHVVLISDGVETCGGDPCGAAKLLTEAGINAKVHVVGFDVGEAEYGKLLCIPTMGNGKYFKANNAEELKLAIAEVRKVAEEKPPVYKEVWRDDFDGEELAEHWEIINPNPDAFIIEGGKLLILGTGLAYLEDKKASNLFRHTQELPKGDWRLTAKVQMEFQTPSESFNLAAYDSHERFISSILFIWKGYSGHRVGSMAMKYTKGKKQSFENGLIIKRETSKTKAKIEIREMARKYPYLVRLEKKGRKYTASMKIEIDSDEKVKGYEITRGWWKMKELTSLRPLKNAVFNLSLGSKSGKGESSVKVDYVMLESVVPEQEQATK